MSTKTRKPSLLAAAIKSDATQLAPELEPTQQASNVVAGSSPADRPAIAYVAPSRANKSAKTHYLPPAYWETLAEISFRSRDENGRRIPQERLLAEALNLLFVKHNYPQVRD